MAEDQGKPEPEGATLPKDEPKKLEEKPPEKPVDGHEEHDEGSQSINLELEEDEEPKADDNNDKLHNAKNETETDDKQEKKEEADPEPAAEEAKADAGPPRNDPKPEEKKQDEPEQELPAEKVTAESEPPADTQELDTATKDDSQATKEDKEEEIEQQEPQPKAEEKKPAEEAEVGIVGPPTAASELLADEELVATEKPTLPTNDTSPKISDRVARWVEASKADEPDELVDDVDDEDKELDEEEEDEEEEEEQEEAAPKKRGRKRKQSNGTNGGNNKKAHKVVNNIIRRSIRCLNKMHAMDGNGAGGGGEKKATDPTAESKPSEEDSSKSPKVPQSQQNGAALPEETASADRNLMHCQATPSKREKKETETEANQQPQPLRTKSPKSELSMVIPDRRPGRPSNQQRKLQQQLLQQQQLKMQQQQDDQQQRPPSRETRKRRAAESGVSGSGANLSSNGSSSPKKVSLDQREQFINSLIGSDKFTAEQLAARAEQLRAEVQDLDELARAKEMEWNEILSMRKLKEEAYLRIERRRQVMGFMEGNGPVTGSESPLPPASLALSHHQQQQQQQQQQHHHQSYESKPALLVPKEERDVNNPVKRERAAKSQSTYQPLQPKIQAENGPKQQQQQQQQQLADAQSPDQRQIGEGRQGPIVDVRSIIADYRLRHPDTLPKRRGRRMRNSVNVGLGAGGAVVENLGNMDSRPSSTDSCKSNSNANDPNNAMSFKDVLVQFAKLSQQQGEPIKTPQNYPDVTLHPVTAAPTTTNSVPQTSGSLLHGILTKSQSPRPTTFSPTLARLLTAPERERSAPTIITPLHQAATQHLLQAYQGANPVSISDFLSSSKARTEITITPVVNNPAQTHSNNLINVDDGEDESSIIEERDSRLSMGNRDNREDRDSPPRCQGCHERSAQFVCAGCGNQWYCSRECQVAAWDEHSEVCSG